MSMSESFTASEKLLEAIDTGRLEEKIKAFKQMSTI
jgi:hypothetical protein